MTTPVPAPAAPPVTLAFSQADLLHWLVLIIVAALCGLVIELLRGGAVPLGWLGGIGSALVGAWIGAEILPGRLPLPSEPAFEGVPLISTVLAALVVAFLFTLLVRSPQRRYR